MHRTMTISAFDMLEVVHIAVHIRDWDYAGSEVASGESRFTVDIPSKGLSTNREWALEAIGMLWAEIKKSPPDPF